MLSFSNLVFCLLNNRLWFYNYGNNRLIIFQRLGVQNAVIYKPNKWNEANEKLI
jgi:hypothetical protein